jgi:predicted DNA-binding WGR domain protein
MFILRHLLECTDGTSDKFYHLWVETDLPTRVHMRYGRRGSNGMYSFKDFSSMHAAANSFRKLFRSKASKGYVAYTPRENSDSYETLPNGRPVMRAEGIHPHDAVPSSPTLDKTTTRRSLIRRKS